MTGKQRVRLAMEHGQADRVPVFCQLSLGHYMLHTPFEPYRIWYSPQVFAEALLQLAEKYRFDGILVNLPGRPRDWEQHIISKEIRKSETVLYWDDNSHSVCPDNDNVHNFSERPSPSFGEVEAEELYYVEPHDITSIDCPYTYGFSGEQRPHDRSFFPDYLMDTLKAVIALAAEEYHVSGEVFSPFSQLMEMLGYTEALIALVENPQKVEAMLENLAAGAAEYALLQAECGPDAILVSSAFAGGGFISLDHYRRFVLPYEARVVQAMHKRTRIPVYVHTCGAIGDRIALMLEAGYDGVDTMDPPPLGNTMIDEVKQRYGKDLFLKGNLDPVNVLLRGSPQDVYDQACWLIDKAGRDGGYILSTACSVAPQASPENIAQLHRASSAHPYD